MGFENNGATKEEIPVTNPAIVNAFVLTLSSVGECSLSSFL